jgi:hypothetical protein
MTEISPDAFQAHSVAVFFCENPRCLRPHIALKDPEGVVRAHFVLPDSNPDGTGFLKQLQDVAYRSAVERNK